MKRLKLLLIVGLLAIAIVCSGCSKEPAATQTVPADPDITQNEIPAEKTETAIEESSLPSCTLRS